MSEQLLAWFGVVDAVVLIGLAAVYLRRKHRDAVSDAFGGGVKLGKCIASMPTDVRQAIVDEAHDWTTCPKFNHDGCM